jgi:hypothetical protein
MQSGEMTKKRSVKRLWLLCPSLQGELGAS